MVSVLKYATPLVGPWLGVLSEEQYEHKFKNDIKLMEELAKKFPEVQYQKANIPDPQSPGILKEYIERVEGAGLRALRSLLEEKDPQQQWGDLRRILTPEGHYLWLCNHHTSSYI
jgi:hypothetical protein